MKDYSSEEILELILAHTQEKILILDSAGIVIHAVKATDSHLCGTSAVDFIGAKHKRRFQSAIQKAISSHTPINCEVQGTLGNEKKGWFSCRISPVHDEKDAAAVLFASDITERRAQNLAKKKRDRQKIDHHANYRRAVENILTMCSETKNVQFADEWMSIEEFLWKQYGFQVSHGLSPEAYENAIKNFKEHMQSKGSDKESGKL